MSDAEAHRSRLRELIADRQLTPVLGAGVSRAAAGLPSWAGLLESGLSHAAVTGSAGGDEVEAARAMLDRGELVAAAQRLREMLGAPAGEYPAWLQSVFEDTEVADPSILHAVFDLQPRLIATTNYDRVVTMVHPRSAHPVTWCEPDLMQRALQGRDDLVFHVHGMYLQPESVVLGVTDYDTLVADEAYRAVLRALWLDRTLLFIGCSVDGLSDPDFDALVTWAHATFGPGAYTHYALVRAEEATADRVRSFLHDRRIQLVPYGNDWRELPGWLEALNPRLDNARAERARLAHEALGAEDGRQQYVRSIEGLAPVDADLAEPANALYATVADADDDARAELVGAQRLLAAVADVDLVAAGLEWWYSEGRRTLARAHLVDPPVEFVDGVRQAGPALFLLRQEFLERLHARGVDVHQRVRDGFCASLVEMMERSGKAPVHSPYLRENLGRILTSFSAILEANPDEVFPPPAEAQMIDEPASLLLIRSNSVDVRPLSAPHRSSTFLSHRGPRIAVQMGQLEGRPVLLTGNCEAVHAWAPRRSKVPVGSIVLPLGEGTAKSREFAHRSGTDGLHTTVLWPSGAVADYVDFQPAAQWHLDGVTIYDELATHPDGTVFIVHKEHGFRTVRGGKALPLVSVEEIIAMVRPYPGLAATTHLKIWSVVPGTLAGRSVLALVGQCRQELQALGHSVVVFVDVDARPAQIAGLLDVGDRQPVTVAWGDRDDGVSWLHVGFLVSGGRPAEIAWAESVRTRLGLLFVQQGSMPVGERDVMGLVADGPSGGWACDSWGRVVRYTTAGEGTVEEVAPEGEVDVQDLLLANWEPEESL